MPSPHPTHWCFGVRAVLVSLWALMTVSAWAAPVDHAVRLTAQVQSAPPQITLVWQPLTSVTTLRVYRKAPNATTWGTALATLETSATEFVDTDVQVGTRYEYKVEKAGTPLATGYILAGIQVPLVEGRGTLLLIVDNTYAADLATELTRLEDDLIGDGWRVIRHDVARTATPAQVRALIQADYAADPANVKSVFLFGRVPIARSGRMAPDGHEARPWPADAYYGDIDGTWTDTQDLGDNNRPSDGIFDQMTLPSDVELHIGRVDLGDLPAFAPKTEKDLLKQYLDKDHRFRVHGMPVQTKAFVDDNFGEFSGEAFAQNSWRNFTPLLGQGNTSAGEWTAKPVTPFLWGYGCGGGSNASCGSTVTTTEMVENDPAVFTFLFGSYFGQWNPSNNLLRAALATDEYGLTCAWAGRPNWFVHQMALGEPIGYSARLSQNNPSNIYQPTNYGSRFIHVALMGDPTLRLHPIAPVSNLTAVTEASGVRVTWTASVDPVLGYHIYRADTPAGPFTRVSTALVTGTTFLDADVPYGAQCYMVRAVVLQDSPSGTYYNASIGVRATAAVPMPEIQPDLLIRATGDAAYLGDNLIEAPAQQTRNATLVSGRQAIFQVRLQNDGRSADTFRVTGAPESAGWEVRYFEGFTGTHDITAEVTGAGWSTGQLASGAEMPLRIEVTALPVLSGALDLSVSLTATSLADPTCADTVLAVIRRGGGMLERVSLSSTKVPGAGDSWEPAISADGRFVAFQSQAPNLAAPDTATDLDVFLRDRQTGETILVSVAMDGADGNGYSYSPSLSADGRVVAFSSNATNLVTDAATGNFVYVRDLNSGVTERIPSPFPVEATGIQCTKPAISANGRYVVYVAQAVLPDNGNQGGSTGDPIYLTGRIVLFDRQLRTTEQISISPTGAVADAACYSPAVSEDGRFVTFFTEAANLVADDTNDCDDIFLRDRQSGTTTRVSVTSTGAQSPGASTAPVVTPDGRYLAFISEAALTPADTNATADAYVLDRTTGVLTMESPQVGPLLPDGRLGLSADGRYLTFTSSSTLFPGDTNGVADVFLRDRQREATSLVSMATDGTRADAVCTNGALSADGRFVVFTSAATTLEPAEPGTFRDVWLVDRGSVVQYRPDLKSTSAYYNFPGNDVYSPDGTGQVLTNIVIPNGVATFALGVENDGNSAGEFRLTAPASQAGWGLRYFDMNNADITGQVTGSGWVRRLEPKGAVSAIRVEMRPQSAVVGGTTLVVPVTLAHVDFPEIRDTMRLEATLVIPQPQPDLSVKLHGDTDPATPFLGEGVFTLPEQTYTQRVPNGTVAITAGSLRNAGNFNDTLVLKGTLNGGAGWTVRAYNSLEAGHDVTAAFFSTTGWQLPIPVGHAQSWRIEMRAARGVARASSATVLVTARSIQNGTRIDAVQVTTASLGEATQLVSLTDSEGIADSASLWPSCSGDGRLVAFTSAAANLVPGDTNRVSDIFVRDRQVGTTRRVSISAARTQTNDWSDQPALSRDGRFVAFRSAASNLVDGDTNGVADIFLVSLETGAVERASAPVAGGQSNGGSAEPTLSADGRFVAFTSMATTLVAGDTNSVADVFLLDRHARTLTRMSQTALGVQANGASDNPALAADGSVVLFRSAATNLVAADTNRQLDVFAAVTATRALTRVSISTAAVQGNGASGIGGGLVVSTTGRYVAFRSHATNLVTGDTNGVADVFLHDRTARTTICVSHGVTAAANAESGANGVAISADGQYVAFTSSATNLLAGDVNGIRDVFVRNWTNGTLACVSRDSLGAWQTREAGQSAQGVAMSADGHFIVFETLAALEADDTNLAGDLYLRDRVDEVAHSARPDLLLRAATEQPFLGEAIYSEALQVKLQGTGAGVAAGYVVRLVNRGRFADRLRMTGPAGTADWQVTYRLAGTPATELTSLVSGPGWVSPSLAAGTGIDVLVEVTPRRGLAVGASLPVRLMVASESDGFLADVCRLETQVAPLTAVRLQASPVSRAVIGSRVTLTAAPVGGSAVEYRFRAGIKSGTGYSWTDLLTVYQTGTTFEWTPPAPGAYVLVVLAREQGARTALSSTLVFTVTPTPLTDVALTLSPATGIQAATPVTLSARATGAWPAQYKFRVAQQVNGSWMWATVQDYSTAEAYRWTPGSAGTYLIAVYARALGNSNAYDAFATYRVTVGQ
jgi:Tol biopolymer transport system component